MYIDREERSKYSKKRSKRGRTKHYFSGRNFDVACWSRNVAILIKLIKGVEWRYVRDFIEPESNFVGLVLRLVIVRISFMAALIVLLYISLVGYYLILVTVIYIIVATWCVARLVSSWIYWGHVIAINRYVIHLILLIFISLVYTWLR